MCGIVLGPVYTIKEFLTDNKKPKKMIVSLYKIVMITTNRITTMTGIILFNHSSVGASFYD